MSTKYDPSNEESNEQHTREITPQQAVEDYLDSIKSDFAKSTVYNYRYRLRQFLNWADESGLEVMSDLDSYLANRFRDWFNNGERAPSTVNNHMWTVQTFFHWCETRNVLRKGVSEDFQVPELREGEDVRNVELDKERAESILAWLRKYSRASFEHVVFGIMLRTGARTGGVHSLDVKDWQKDEQGSRVLHFENRPETDTTLKREKGGARYVRLKDRELSEAISEYIEHNRYKVTDEHGREPLLTTRHGRPNKSTIQKKIYAVTSCRHVGDCDDPDCPSTSAEKASQCSLSVSPHALRHTYVTEMLNRGTPKALLGPRVGATPDTLDKHYSEQTPEDEYNARKDELEDYL